MRFSILVFLLAQIWGAAAFAHDLSGKVEVILKGEKKKNDLSTVIVYLSRPSHATSELLEKISKKEFVLATRDKKFTPASLPVPLGATVNFPNYDPIFHNLFSVSKPNNFDLGLYKGGATKKKRFDQPGIVRVFCNVHPQMSATLVVVDTPYFTTADKRGNFLLAAVESGDYELRAYSVEGQSFQNITVGNVPQNIQISIDARKYKKVQHKNKLGKDYSTNQDERY